MGTDSQTKAFVFVLIWAILLLIASAKKDQAGLTKAPIIPVAIENSTK
jgi:hypothetical protein